MSEMPLAEHGGRVALLFQHFGNRHLVRAETVLRTWPEVAPDSNTRRDATGQQRRSRRRAERPPRIEIGKPHSFFRQLIEMRGFEKVAALTTQIHPAQIIDEDQNDIWFLTFIGTSGTMIQKR